jgi:hypothetical protein
VGGRSGESRNKRGEVDGKKSETGAEEGEGVRWVCARGERGAGGEGSMHGREFAGRVPGLRWQRRRQGRRRWWRRKGRQGRPDLNRAAAVARRGASALKCGADGGARAVLRFPRAHTHVCTSARTRAHARAHKHTRTRTRTRAHARAHAHAHTHVRSHTHVHVHAHMHTRPCSRARTRARTCARAHARAFTHTRMHTRTRTR